MPEAEDIKVFVELTHHSLHALRAVNGTIEAGGESVLENRPALEALLDLVAPGWKAAGFKADVTVWPDGAGWHLSSDTEAMLDRTGDALRTIAATSQADPRAAMAYAVCGSADGGPVTQDGMDKWILTSASQEALGKFSTLMEEIKLESEGIGAAAFEPIAAISAALKAAGSGSVALWDLGTVRSHLILVTAGGVEGVVPCDVGMETIFSAVQAALRLKFRGAGERLFFNEGYDFTEPGPKVGASIGPKVKLALSGLGASGGPPALACIGLTGKQSWFLKEVAAAAGTTHWAPELGTLAAGLGLTFSDASVEAAFSPASAGLFEQVSSRIRKSEAWRPTWTEAEALPEEEPAAEPEPVEAPEPVEQPRPAPAPAPARTRPSIAADPGSLGAPPRSTRPPVTPRPAGAPPPAATFAVPGPATRPPVPAARPPAQEPPRASFDPPAPGEAPRPPAPTARPPVPQAPQAAFNPPEPGAAPRPAAPQARPPSPETRPPSFSRPGFLPPDPPEGTSPGFAPAMPPAAMPPPAIPPPPSAGAKVAAAAGALPQPAVTALPFEAVKPKLAAAAEHEQPEAPPPKSKMGFYIGIGVAAALVFAAIAVVLDARMEKAKAYDLEQQEALAHHVAEQRLKEAEESAKDEAERSRKELETAIEITRKQTEDDTRRRVLAEVEAERIAKLPGTLMVATVPPGASVSIDGGAPLTSPVKLEGLAPGAHQVQISLAGRDPVELKAQIKGSTTTDLGTVTLQSSFGTLGLSSVPDGLDFAVRPANDPAGKPLRTGRAPATLSDLPHGDYIVTFSRAGCRDHVEKAHVEKAQTSTVATKYSDGSLELTSDPSGAWVEKDGDRLGTTPLSLHDLTPKKASFELTLPGYDPTPVTCEIPEGQTLKLEAKLLRRDRIFNENEVKSKPESYDAPQPVLSAAQKRMGAKVLLSLVVRSDGSVSDVVVVNATDDDIARRCKDAVAGWRFKPATASDDRTVDARIELPFNFPSDN